MWSFGSPYLWTAPMLPAVNAWTGYLALWESWFACVEASAACGRELSGFWRGRR